MLRFSLIACPPLLLASIVLYAFSASSYVKKEPFDSIPILRLDKNQSDWVFIGNSMLKTRVDTLYLEEISDKKVTLFKPGGGFSALWFLILKNWVVPAEKKPEAVFVFFRLHTLTEPMWRTEGRYRGLIERASHENEYHFQQVVQGFPSWQKRFYTQLDTRIPMREARENLDSLISKVAFSLIHLTTVPEVLANSAGHNFKTYSKFKKDVNSIFDLSKLRSDQAPELQSDVTGESSKRTGDGAEYFKEVVDTSFLPLMLDVAKEHNLKLTFVQVKSRNLSKLPAEEIQFYQSYKEALKEYLNSKNFVYYDFSNDTTVDFSWYGNGDHIADKFRKPWTKHFLDVAIPKLLGDKD